ncbi:MAG TPA: hypothetical protein VK335_02790 [Bryobacteraceae bacterium]|nr:hypothetical protein [Bryobacteraceae bacterium]
MLELPKRELLLFDRLAVIGLEDLLHLHRNFVHGDPNVADQLEWLEAQDLLERVEPPPPSFYECEEHRRDYFLLGALCRFQEELFDAAGGPWLDAGDGALFRYPEPGGGEKLWLSQKIQSLRLALVARFTADYLRSTGIADAVSAAPMPDVWDDVQPVAASVLGDRKLADAKHSDVAEVVLRAMPLPGETASIEAILDFKSDSDCRQSLIGLRLWMRDVARLDLPTREIEEKLQWLLGLYERHLQRHRLQYDRGIIESVCTTTLEFAENLVKINWSNAAKSLFAVRRRKLALLESEAAAPGREIAYVARASERFRQDSA